MSIRREHSRSWAWVVGVLAATLAAAGAQANSVPCGEDLGTPFCYLDLEVEFGESGEVLEGISVTLVSDTVLGLPEIFDFQMADSASIAPSIFPYMFGGFWVLYDESGGFPGTQLKPPLVTGGATVNTAALTSSFHYASSELDVVADYELRKLRPEVKYGARFRQTFTVRSLTGSHTLRLFQTHDIDADVYGTPFSTDSGKVRRADEDTLTLTQQADLFANPSIVRTAPAIGSLPDAFGINLRNTSNEGYFETVVRDGLDQQLPNNFNQDDALLGDIDTAYSWDFALAGPGSEFTVTVDHYFQPLPEPTAGLLQAAAIVTIGAVARRRSRVR